MKRTQLEAYLNAEFSKQGIVSVYNGKPRVGVIIRGANIYLEYEPTDSIIKTQAQKIIKDKVEDFDFSYMERDLMESGDVAELIFKNKEK